VDIKSLSQYKVIKWEELDPGKYDVVVLMRLFKTKETEDGPFEQMFTLLSLDKVDTEDDQP
jgi:hypothetical protein